MPTRQSGGAVPAPVQNIPTPQPALPNAHAWHDERTAQNQSPTRHLDILAVALSADAPPMYPKEINQHGFTKHSRRCTGRYNRRDLRCHRCVELELGAAPRNGWQHEWLARRTGQLQRKLEF